MLSVRKCMVAGALAAFFTTAGAQQGACKEDVDKLCKDVQPGEGKILACLKSHQSEVSPKCAGHLKQVQEQIEGSVGCVRAGPREVLLGDSHR